MGIKWCRPAGGVLAYSCKIPSFVCPNESLVCFPAIAKTIKKLPTYFCSNSTVFPGKYTQRTTTRKSKIFNFRRDTLQLYCSYFGYYQLAPESPGEQFNKLGLCLKFFLETEEITGLRRFYRVLRFELITTYAGFQVSEKWLCSSVSFEIINKNIMYC